MATAKAAQQPRPSVLVMPIGDLVRVLLAGAVVGLVTAAIYALLDVYVFTPTLCADALALTGRCASKLEFASTLAMIIGGIAGLLAMVQLRTFRPLLVVLLATAGLWGILTMMNGWAWWQVALGAGVLHALAYGAFAWLAQIRRFLLAAALGIVVVVILRVILTI